MFFINRDQSSPERGNTIETSKKDLKVISELYTKLTAQRPNKIELHILELANSPWTKDPFLNPVEGLNAKKTSSVAKGNHESLPKAANWVYSGYLEVEGKRLAIINGLEYEEGERLFPLGYYLARVYRSHVTIAMVGKKVSFTLPLSEP